MVLRGAGTPTVDGIEAVGEWDGAARVDFTANRLPEEGGGTAPASLFVMNDAVNLYAAVKVARASLGSSSIGFEFDNDHDGRLFEEGHDAVVVNPSPVPPVFFDDFRTSQPPCPPGAVCGLLDTDAGGTTDGGGAATNNGQFSFYELSHPLDSADDAHDFSLRTGNRVGFQFDLRFCGQGCVDTNLPAIGTAGDIVITSRNAIPPETVITAGLEEGSANAQAEAVFSFTGADDAIAAADLEFECRLDSASFAGCTSPVRYAPLSEGEHAFAVRASDEALNTDPTPAARHWTVDLTAPETVFSAGPARTSRVGSATFSFSGTDNLTPAGSLSFQCRRDGGNVSPCTSPVKLTALDEGMHRLTVTAIDQAGNGDATPAQRGWTVDLRPPRKPLIRGPRQTGSRRPTYRFSSSDAVTRRTDLRFRCAFDSRRLRPCPPVYRRRLSLGRHVLYVAALDEVADAAPLPAPELLSCLAADGKGLGSGSTGLRGRSERDRNPLRRPAAAKLRCAVPDGWAEKDGHEGAHDALGPSLQPRA